MIKNLYSLSIAIVFFLFHVGPVKGQADEVPGLKKIAAPSPNAASLGKYGDMPVGHYTGIPEINIPIYTIKSHDLVQDCPMQVWQRLLQVL
jgi:hypothetical protein